MSPERPRKPDDSSRKALGFFLTRIRHQLPDDRQLLLHSRSHRKGLQPVRIDTAGRGTRTAPVLHPWLSLWAPGRLAWWIALLFMAGSTCFALAAFASNWPQHAPSWLGSGGIINTVFFVGSIFFTSAAWLQLLESINGDIADFDPSAASGTRNWRWFAWKPHNAGYSASLIQFVGTVLFNFNTADAMISGLSWAEEELLIWTPNILGSVCFLVASQLALIEVSHRLWSFQPRQLGWWVASLNMLGSIAFMLAALFSFYLPSTASPEWVWGANTFTLLGALCFLTGSYLMIPELFGAGSAIDAPLSLPEEDL
jgi:hypothetical protein